MSDAELTISVGQTEPSAFRLVATLGIAGMLAGLVLATVYQLTKPVIEANRARELRLGVFKVVPGSTRLQKLVLQDGRLVPVAEDQVVTEPVLHAAYDESGRFLGWAISGEGPGFQDTISVLYGYDPAARGVTGMHVLLSRETPGIGDKIYKDAEFVANFAGLAVDPEIVVVKDGRDAANEVDAITGATISSQAVVRVINEAQQLWEPMLPPPGSEPPLREPPASGEEQ